MSGRIGLLSALLALQLVIIAGVLLLEAGVGEPEQGPFLEFEVAAVDQLSVTGDDGAAVTLTRAGDGWQLPGGLPADADKIDDVLEKLAGLSSPWPVATSGSAAGRFEVAEDAFQRHVVLESAGDVVADVYLGTSPGYQQVHARKAGDASVYSVGLSNYQLPAEADQWLDKALLQPRGDVTALERQGAWRLYRGEDGWQLAAAEAEGAAEAPPGVTADQDAAAELVRRVAELRVTGVAEAPAAGTEPAAVLAVTDAEGTYRLTLMEAPQGNDYAVRSERRDGWFAVAGYLAEQLLSERASLLPAAEDAQDGTAPDAPQASDEAATAEDSGA